MSAETRLSRQDFWIASVLVWAAFFGGRPLLAQWPMLSLGWSAAALLALLVLMRARLLDRGRDPWWLLPLGVPVFGALWLFWELACRRSDDAGVPRG